METPRYPFPDLNTLPEDIRAKILEVQDKAGFVAVFDEVVVRGLAVIDNAHLVGPNMPVCSSFVPVCAPDGAVPVKSYHSSHLR